MFEVRNTEDKGKDRMEIVGSNEGDEGDGVHDTYEEEKNTEIYGADVEDEPDEVYGADVEDEPGEIYGAGVNSEADEVSVVDVTGESDEIVGMYEAGEADEVSVVYEPGGSDEVGESDEVSEVYEAGGLYEAVRLYESGEVDEVSEVYEAGEADEVNRVYEPGGSDEAVRLYESGEVDEVSEVYEPSEADEVSEVYEPGGSDEVSEAYEAGEADEVNRVYEPGEADEVVEVYEPGEADEVSRVYGPGGLDEAVKINMIYGIDCTGDIDDTSGSDDMYEVSEAYGIIEADGSGRRHGKKRRSGVLRVMGRVILVLATFVVVTFVGAYSTLWVICNGTSKAAKNLFVSTILETGALKFLASWYFTDEEILAITDENSMSQIFEDVNTGMISVQSPSVSQGTPGDGSGGTGDTVGSEESGNQDGELAGNPDGIRIEEIAGRSFMAKMMIVSDPSRVKLATIYPWSDDNQSKDGKTLGELVTEGGYLAGVNGGEYYSNGNWGGKPKGLVVCEGQIQYNVPQKGDVMIGFNRDNILVVKDIGAMTAKQVEEMVEKERIRDAVSFKDVKGNNNHFTKLIINGKAREISGSGSGANPRTAIGQREDGTVLMLVTDGRGASGHLGATAADLIAIMQEYGAVNAANLDGGSSSAMYYNGAYEMTSVTLYYSTSSWKLPTAYVVERRD